MGQYPLGWGSEDAIPKPTAERERDVLDLTAEHEASYRTLHAWHRDTEEAESRGFKGGCLTALVVSTLGWAVIIWCLHHWRFF